MKQIENNSHKVSFHWYKNHQIVSSTNRLVINDLSTNNIGFYECQFQSKYGLSKKVFKIDFNKYLRINATKSIAFNYKQNHFKLTNKSSHKKPSILKLYGFGEMKAHGKFKLACLVNDTDSKVNFFNTISKPFVKTKKLTL